MDPYFPLADVTTKSQLRGQLQNTSYKHGAQVIYLQTTEKIPSNNKALTLIGKKLYNSLAPDAIYKYIQ